MSEQQDPLEFTDREIFILSYYRAADLAHGHRYWLWDAAIAVGSLICLCLYINREDAALGFVAYSLAIGRWLYIIIQGRRWHHDFRHIFAKYDAKLKTLEEALRRKGSDNAG